MFLIVRLASIFEFFSSISVLFFITSCASGNRLTPKKSSDLRWSMNFLLDCGLSISVQVIEVISMVNSPETIWLFLRLSIPLEMDMLPSCWPVNFSPIQWMEDFFKSMDDCWALKIEKMKKRGKKKINFDFIICVLSESKYKFLWFLLHFVELKG